MLFVVATLKNTISCLCNASYLFKNFIINCFETHSSPLRMVGKKLGFPICQQLRKLIAKSLSTCQNPGQSPRCAGFTDVSVSGPSPSLQGAPVSVTDNNGMKTFRPHLHNVRFSLCSKKKAYLIESNFNQQIC